MNCFCNISGFKLNMGKSLIVGINADQKDLNHMARELGYSVGNWLITYLGLPLRGNPIKNEIWSAILKKVSKRLES